MLLGRTVSHENETLRWPTDLDRAAIVQRLADVRELAAQAGLAEIADRLVGVEYMNAAQIGSNVIGALTWIQDKPQHDVITSQLAMVAMNLKNLK